MDFFIALYKDLLIERVWDVGTGSAAAACAALILGLPYEGFCMSEKHLKWTENILDKIMFTVLADAEAEEDEAIRADVLQHFGDLADDSQIFLKALEDDDDSQGTSDEEYLEHTALPKKRSRVA